jgi:type I restriction enzyme S subunit
MNIWETVKLGDVCEIVMGQSPPSSTYNTEQKGLPFFQGKAEFTELYPEVRKWCSEPQKIAVPGDILVSVRAPVGSTNIANQKCCIGRGLAAIRYSNCNKFILYFFRLVEKDLDKLGTGTTFKAISTRTLYNISIPLPPLPEQKKIVAKIEELFSELDSGVASLKKAKGQIKNYRQSVLAYAFSGKLTNGHPELVSGSEKLNQVQLDNSQLPKGWKWVKLGEEFRIVSGNTPKGLEKISGNGSISFYKVSDMNAEGNEKYMNTSNIYLTKEEILKLKIKLFPKHTVIFPKRGGAILTNKKRLLSKESAFDLNIMGILPNNKVNPFYLFYWVLKLDLTTIFDGSNVPQINNKNIEPLDFPLPSLDHQHQIVSEIERRFSVADKLEQTIDESLEKAEQLKQSILKKAFEGRLV